MSLLLAPQTGDVLCNIQSLSVCLAVASTVDGLYVTNACATTDMLVCCATPWMCCIHLFCRPRCHSTCSWSCRTALVPAAGH